MPFLTGECGIAMSRAREAPIVSRLPHRTIHPETVLFHNPIARSDSWAGLVLMLQRAVGRR
jgi:hypothetical protein